MSTAEDGVPVCVTCYAAFWTAMVKRIARELDGNNTEIVLQTFADRTLVLVTQLGKVGNLVNWLKIRSHLVKDIPKIQATLPPTTPLLPVPAPDPDNPNTLLLPPPPPAVQLVPLFGNAPSEHIQVLHSLFASQIATLIWASESESVMQLSRRAVVVGIALRPGQTTALDDTSLSNSERALFGGVMGLVQELLSAK